MEKLNRNKITKIISIMLVLAWMITVFKFSSENGDKSSSTSRKVTTTIVQTFSDKDIEENEQIIISLDKIVRKIAHYTIYTIGGIVITNLMYTTSNDTKKKIIYSIITGAGYAITDEIHQYFVSNRSARIFDVGIDTLGVITGVLIFLVLLKIRQKVANSKK